jgi:hypothetical protein
MKRFYLVIINLLFLLPVYPVLAQNGDTDTGDGEAAPQGDQASGQGTSAAQPEIIRQQPYKYYYWPEENLDNFGLSTLGNGQGGSTLGRSLERKSNLEVNSPKAPEKNQEDTDGGSGMLFPSAGEDIDTETVIEDEAPRSPASEKPMYEWVDEKGNIHITNNIGDVPLKYQNDVYKRQGGAEEK